MTVSVLDDLSAKTYEGYNLWNFEVDPLIVRVKKATSFEQFKTYLCELRQLPMGGFRVWAFTKRQNMTLRPDAVIGDSCLSLCMILDD